jgi:hypothetical protein
MERLTNKRKNKRKKERERMTDRQQREGLRQTDREEDRLNLLVFFHNPRPHFWEQTSRGPGFDPTLHPNPRWQFLRSSHLPSLDNKFKNDVLFSCQVEINDIININLH